MVGSLDVKALYPSLDHHKTTKTSNIQVRNVDYMSAHIFHACNMTESDIKKEGLPNLNPKRKHRKGRRPGKTSSELSYKRPREG